jgi:hypothetical protein
MSILTNKPVSPDAALPNISMRWVECDGGGYAVEMVVSGLASESQAQVVAHLERELCGAAISSN